MNVRDLLITLLKGAIKGEMLDTELITQSLSESKLATLFKVSKKHDVAHLIAYVLEKSEISLNEDAWKLFLQEKEQARLRYEMIQADINEICSCFDKEEILYIPLKGARIREYYPAPWMRTSCDIDILVREEELDRAVNSLVSDCSYTTDYKKTYHDVSLYSPFGMHLELHYNIKETVEKYDELLTQVWAFSKKSRENGHKYLQTNEFLIFHLVAHMAYHFVNGGCGLRSVLDLWLIKQKLEIDNDILSGFFEKAGLTKFYEVICNLSEYWFGEITSVDDITKETEIYILLGGVYGTDKQNATSKQIKKGGKVKYFWTRIFMPYEGLAILYPIIKKHKVLTPFFQIVRWFSIMFKGKRIKNEIKNVTSVSQEQLEKTRALLNGLEL